MKNDTVHLGFLFFFQRSLDNESVSVMREAPVDDESLPVALETLD